VSNRKDINVRVAAAVCMIIAIATGGCAATQFKANYPAYAKQVKEDLGRFCQRHHDNFTATGSVADGKHGGRPPKLPHGIALEASKRFKAGTVVKAFPNADAKRKVDVHIWWTSIDIACAQSQALRDICTAALNRLVQYDTLYVTTASCELQLYKQWAVTGAAPAYG
jgi:hypothetical protein